MNVVIDTNVFISAVFWPGEARRCFALWGRRRFHLALTPSILEEHAAVAERLAAGYPDVNPGPWLDWVHAKGKIYEPAPLGKRRSADVRDDIFLACALASGASIIVSLDKHLLEMGKPFGVEILTPRNFLRHLR